MKKTKTYAYDVLNDRIRGGAEVGYDRNDNDDMRPASCEDRMEIDRDI